jgi:hypothetical protein
VPTSSHRRISKIVSLITLLVISCDASVLLPSVAAPPTLDPGAVRTIIAGTAAAAETQTAANIPPTQTPTLTPPPTWTPTPLPSLTPTFIFLLRSPTPSRTATSELDYLGSLACKLISQTPSDGAQFDPGSDFDAIWKVQNVGTAAWDSNSIDFVYFSGDKLYKNNNKIYDLANSVSVNGTISLIADMTAPDDPGKYKTVYTLRMNQDDFCHVTLTIKVR